MTQSTDNRRQDISIAITGSGGAGVLTAGEFLLAAAARLGCYGLQTRSVGPQIRGGESAALLRLSQRPVEIHAPHFDVLLALDWNNYNRFADEIPLTSDSVVVTDAAAGEIPTTVSTSTANIIELPVQETAEQVSGGRANMVALGVIAAGVGIPAEVVAEVIADKLGAKGQSSVDASTASLREGVSLGSVLEGHVVKLRSATDAGESKHWLLSGNEAAGLGAVRGGVRFAAAYPITPATEILEWLAPALNRVGGRLVQAEDELASINMIIGASYGGVPALTATSGPGLALMTESIGLAAAAEVPVVIVDVMRGGPSTGIPTKSEQSDLNIAVYGLHGDAPHVVVAPISLADCVFTTQWAVHLAEVLQTPAIVLSDQFLGQARMIVDRPADVAFIGERRRADECRDAYARYQLSASGVSPMAVPGEAGGQYTAEGLAHTTTGTPSSSAGDHQAQLAKRRHKIEDFAYGDHWAEIEGEGDVVALTWGSTAAPVREAAERARADGVAVKTIAVRLLAPLQVDALLPHLEGARRVLVVEQNESGQFHRYLRSQCDLPAATTSINAPGPLPIGADRIHHAMTTREQ